MKYLMLIILLSITNLLNCEYLSETWDSGKLSTNGWTLESAPENWKIMSPGGFHLRFSAYPAITQLNSALVSRVFNGTNSEQLSLQFHTLGSALSDSIHIRMKVEYQIVGGDWVQLLEVQPTTLSLHDPLTSYNIPLNICDNHQFRIRFRIHGVDSTQLMAWRLDNIKLWDDSYQVPATVSGSVQDIQGNPISNVLVATATDCCRSDNNGMYSLDLQPVNHTLSFSAFGFAATEALLNNLTSGVTTTYNAVLQPPLEEIDAFALQCLMNYGMESPLASLSWVGHQQNAIEIKYDDGQAMYYYSPFMINECEYLVSRYVSIEALDAICLKLAVKSFMPNSIHLVAFPDSNGVPDMMNPYNLEMPILEYDPLIPGEPEWIQAFLNLSLPANTPFYLGVKFVPSDNYMVGIANSIGSHAFYAFDSEDVWEPLENEEPMFRVLGQAQFSHRYRLPLGYNIYRNDIKLNEQPVTIGSYQDPNPLFGTNVYQVRAVYPFEEGNGSNRVSAIAQRLLIRSISFQNDETPAHIRLRIMLYNNNEPVNELKLFKDQVCIWNHIDIPAATYVNEFYVLDEEFENDNPMSYQLVAYFANGEVMESEVYSYSVYLPPVNLDAIGIETGVHLSWQAPGTDRALLGYRIKRNNPDFTDIQIDLPITLSYTDNDVNQGEIYEYYVTAIYDSGEGMIGPVVVVAGLPQLYPPSDLCGEGNGQGVNLHWQRPTDGKQIIHKDHDNHGGTFSLLEDQSAGMIFNPWELSEFEGYNISGIGFVPSSNGSYQVRLYRYDDFIDEMMLIHESSCTVENPGTWIHIPVINGYIYGSNNPYLIEINCTTVGNIAMDAATQAVTGANLIKIDGEWQNLEDLYGISSNWKIRLKIDEPESVTPFLRYGLYPDLQTYRVFKNNEFLQEVSDYQDYFLDPQVGESAQTYHVTAVYDMGESLPSDIFTYNPSDNDDNIANLVSSVQQNYPNPFNPVTNIEFSLSEIGMIQMDVYNQRGQKVKTLVKGIFSKGKHTITWDAKDENGNRVASGIYYYRFRTNGIITTKKMILSK